jgi:hypothetical protein
MCDVNRECGTETSNRRWPQACSHHITLDFQTNVIGWQPEFQHAYYFKSKDGQVYGRMTINITADFQPPPTYFGAEIYANPAGSRNLEFDPKKQIR